jgi:hypothetical protein
MRTIRPCSSCAAPVSLKMTRCPHCLRSNPLGMLARAASLLAAAVGGVSITSTLAACYGAPCADGEDDCPKYIPTCDEISQTPMTDDADGDHYCKSYDCNEKDPKINARATDIPGDGIDQNCDGKDATK